MMDAFIHGLRLVPSRGKVALFFALTAAYWALNGWGMQLLARAFALDLALALLLMHMSHGQRWVGERSALDYRSWMGWGLLIAGATGLASWWYGAPFLTTTYDYPWLPGVGSVPMASAAAFDLGVYLVVVGATVVMLTDLGRLSVKASR